MQEITHFCRAGQISDSIGIGKDHRIPLAELKCMSPKRVKVLDSYLGVGRGRVGQVLVVD